MRYLIQTSVIAFTILFAASMGFAFGVHSLLNLPNLNNDTLGVVIPSIGSFGAHIVGGFVAWKIMLRIRPTNDRDDITHYWIKKFVIITAVAGTISAPWDITFNLILGSLIPDNFNFAMLISQFITAFSFPIGLGIAWVIVVQRKPIPDKYTGVYHWANRVIFILIVMSAVHGNPLINIILQMVLPLLLEVILDML